MATISFTTKAKGLTSQQTVSQKGNAAVEGELIKTKYEDALLTMSNVSTGAAVVAVDFKDKNDIKVNVDFDSFPHIRAPSDKGVKRKAEEEQEGAKDAAKEPKKKKAKTDKDAAAPKAPKEAKKSKKKQGGEVIGTVQVFEVTKEFDV